MKNPYDIYEADQAPQPTQVPGARTDNLRPILWVLLVVSAASNMVATSAGLNVLFGIGFGLLTLACVTAIVVHHYANRTR